jgi:hypothetical protein
VRSAIAHDETSHAPTIRVPGFLLAGDRVSPTKTMRPAEYASVDRSNPASCGRVKSGQLLQDAFV